MAGPAWRRAARVPVTTRDPRRRRLAARRARDLHRGRARRGQPDALLPQGRGGREQRLLFDVDPGLAPGAPLKVWGRRRGGAAGVVVRAVPRRPSTPTIQAALIGAQPFPARTFAFVLIDIGGGVNRTTDDVMARMIDAPDSIRNYYMYASYGMQDITARWSGRSATRRPTATPAPMTRG